MSEDIVLYDIGSRDVKDIAWSPNTWKTRFCLNIKGLSYRTVWVEYPDIARVCQEIGAEPTSTFEADSEPSYTLPVIYDPSTKTALSESARIVRYLDETYPDTPVLVPTGTSALHVAFQEVFRVTVQLPMHPLMLPPTNDILNPPSVEYCRRKRERFYGDLEDCSLPGPLREKHWQALRAGLHRVSEWMAFDREGTSVFMGDTIYYADVTIAAWLIWIKKVLGPDAQEWVNIKGWDDGKWGTFMTAFEPFEIVR